MTKGRKSLCNRKGCKSMCASPSAEVSPKSARAKVSHGRKARVCYVIGKGRKSAICEKAYSLPRTLCARKTSRAQGCKSITADESRKSPPIAQGYEVTHERASLASLSRLTKGESLLPIAQGYEVVRERAQTFESRLVAREEVKSATAFVLFLFEKIHNFDCAVTIFTQKH